MKKSGMLWDSCDAALDYNILCEDPIPRESSTQSILINGTRYWPLDAAYVLCPLGHYTHQFLACDFKTSCFHRYPLHCKSYQTFFTCTDSLERVPYTLLCDHRSDCVDSSDEDFCSFLPCQTGQFLCDNKQCITSTKLCDGWADCFDREDEKYCKHSTEERQPVPPPALVAISVSGHLDVRPLNTKPSMAQEGTCPDTHFQCLDNGNCLPVFLRCNGVYDCPGREDETDCEVCPGFYRCRTSSVCLHFGDICNGHFNCPQHDDELVCNFTCPPFCICRGLSFLCNRNFTASTYPLLRFLDANGSTMTPAQLTGNRRLIHLSLSNCGLTDLDGMFLPNLLNLNVENNQLNSFSQLHMEALPQLRELSVADNPIALVFKEVQALHTFPTVLRLDLSHVVMHSLNVSPLSAFPNLQALNLSHSGVQRVLGEGFRVVEQLRVLDFRGCPMTWFPQWVFDGLNHLQTVHADSFKVCCPAVLPADFNLHKCFAPSDEISSCNDLLREKSYSICVFILSFFSLIGNAVSFIFRTCISKKENKHGYSNFVTHLSVSDFIMGTYLAIIGVADQVYRGIYLWSETDWKHSVACQFTGFLAFLSSEVSVLIMCLITIDRFLVLTFPFGRLHFSSRSAHTASVVVWIVGLLLVSVPLLPQTSHWEFYSQTAICIPLPITKTDFAGRDYSFSVIVVFNCIVFIFISMGQLSIYWSVRSNSMSMSNTSKKTKDLTLARRLITVAMTDFMCWFPIGVLGMLALNGVVISGEVNVAMAIFVMPLNAAVNSCLYTFNVITERRSRAREENLRRLLLLQLKTAQ